MKCEVKLLIHSQHTELIMYLAHFIGYHILHLIIC